MVALSPWTVLDLGVVMVAASITALTTRTGGAGPISRPRLSLTMVMGVLTATTTCSARPLVALSQLIVLELGILMDLATTRVLSTRTTGAGTTSTPRALLITVMAAHTATTTSSARTVDVLSLWTV